jgi:hypothetical protein
MGFTTCGGFIISEPGTDVAAGAGAAAAATLAGFLALPFAQPGVAAQAIAPTTPRINARVQSDLFIVLLPFHCPSLTVWTIPQAVAVENCRLSPGSSDVPGWLPGEIPALRPRSHYDPALGTRSAGRRGYPRKRRAHPVRTSRPLPAPCGRPSAARIER